MAGVSLAMGFVFYLAKNLAFWSASQFWAKDFFSQGYQRTQKYLVYFKDDESLVGRKIRPKPCKSLCESAPG